MAAQLELTGISAMFGANDIECLVRTAGDAVWGARDDLSPRQLELAQRVHSLIHSENGQPEDDRAARLRALAEELQVKDLDLDDFVHDLVSQAGSDINNGGLSAQIAYLLDELGEADAERKIRAAAQP